MSLLELDRARVAPGSRASRRDRGPRRRGSRGRASRQALEAALAGMGYTAAIIKITSHCKSLKATQKAIEYIRHDCNQVENELGQDRTIDQAKADAAHWKKPRHRGARTSTQMVISFKRGTDVAAAQETVRAFAAESFAGHQYVIGWHTDKKGHPHAHLVICAPGEERALNIDPARLQAMRERLAQLARERGIRMHARSYPHRHRSERHLPHNQDRAARRKGGPDQARRKRAERLARAIRSKTTREILTKVRKERERRAAHEARALVKVGHTTGNRMFFHLAAGRLRELEKSQQRRTAPLQYFTEGMERDARRIRERLRLLHDIYRNAGPEARHLLATLRRETTEAHRQHRQQQQRERER